MPISEFDLYKREWLSLVFKNRNQQYGAYKLRGHYANVLSLSMAITFLAAVVFGIIITIVSRSKAVPADPVYKITHIDNTINMASVTYPLKS